MPELLLNYHDGPMFRLIEIRRHTRDGSEQVRGAWQYAARQPSWVASAALSVFFFILMLPLLALVLLALLLGTLVFVILTAANGVISVVRSLRPRRDGRENVRVMRRDGK
jgi:hypothetical protein